MTISLSFKKAHSGLKFLKSETMPTILPLSVMAEHSINDPIAQAEIPIFFSVKHEHFTVFFADNFLKDLDSKELNITAREWEIHSESDGSKYAALSYKTLKELRESFSNPESFFNRFKAKYEDHIADIQNGELVIFLAFKNKPSTDAITNNRSHIFSEELKKAITGSTSSFEYFKAYKFNNTYYLLDKEGNVDQKSSFHLDKNSKQDLHYLVMPYTEDNFTFIYNIHQKIKNIKNNIHELFKGQENTGLLDKSFSETNNPLLENLTSSVKRLKP